MKVRTMIILPYGRRLRIFVGKKKSYQNYLKKHYDIERDLPEKHGEFCEYEKNDKSDSFLAIWLFDLKYNSELQALLAHECMHCVFRVLTNAGIEYTYEGEEAYTYLLQYLVEEINNLVLGENKK